MRKIRLASYFLLFFLPFNGTAHARVLNLREVYLDFKQFGPNPRNPLIDDVGLGNRELDKELSLYLNTDISKYGFFDQHVYSLTDRPTDSEGEYGQFRLIGWNFQLGVRVLPYLSAGYDHFSKHLLDHEDPNKRFPVQDSIFVRLYLYRQVDPPSIFE